MPYPELRFFKYFFLLFIFLSLFIAANLNQNIILIKEINLLKNFIVFLPTIFFFFNLKLFLNKSFLFLLLIFSPLLFFGFVGIINYVIIISLVIFSIFFNIFFTKEKFLNLHVINHLKKFLFFFYLIFISLVIFGLLSQEQNNYYGLDQLNISDFFSGVTTNVNLLIIYEFQMLFKYSKYFDQVILFIIFFIYIGQPKKFLKKNLLLIFFTLIFLTLQGNALSILLFCLFIFFVQFQKYIISKKFLMFVLIITTLIFFLDIFFFHNKNIQYEKYLAKNKNNSNISYIENVNEIFDNTLILNFLDKASSFRLQRIIAPCDFLKRRYNRYPSIYAEKIDGESYQYRCHYYDDKVKLISNEFLNYRFESDFNRGSRIDKLIRYYHLDSGVFEILYKYGLIVFLIFLFVNIYAIFLVFRLDYTYGIVALILFVYFIFESGLYSTGNLFSMLYNFILTRTFFLKNFNFNYENSTRQNVNFD